MQIFDQIYRSNFIFLRMLINALRQLRPVQIRFHFLKINRHGKQSPKRGQMDEGTLLDANRAKIAHILPSGNRGETAGFLGMKVRLYVQNVGHFGNAQASACKHVAAIIISFKQVSRCVEEHTPQTSEEMKMIENENLL